MTYYLVVVKEQTKNRKNEANSSHFKNVPLGLSPNNKITNITYRKEENSTDKSTFKQYFPSDQKTLL